jgi:co-chaperonin GroES (HSP10)
MNIKMMNGFRLVKMESKKIDSNFLSGSSIDVSPTSMFVDVLTGEKLCIYKYSLISANLDGDTAYIVNDADVLFSVGESGDINMRNDHVLCTLKKDTKDIFESTNKTICDVIESGWEEVKKGDVILYSRGSGVVVTIDGVDNRVFKNKEILAKV